LIQAAYALSFDVTALDFCLTGLFVLEYSRYGQVPRSSSGASDSALMLTLCALQMLVLLLLLLLWRTFGIAGARIVTGRSPFLSSKQHCRSTKWMCLVKL